MMKEATLLHTNVKVVVKEVKHFQITADKTLDGIKQVINRAGQNPLCAGSIPCLHASRSAALLPSPASNRPTSPLHASVEVAGPGPD